MKILAFILSMVILSQSLSAHMAASFDVNNCLASDAFSQDQSLLTSSTNHQCCSDNNKSSSDSDSKDDCCDDHCKCMCCIKVLLTSFIDLQNNNSNVLAYTKRNVMPVMVHSYDFHPSISYPPQA